MRFQGILGASPHSGKEGESLYALLGFKNPEKQSRKCKKKKTKTKLTCKTETKTALKKKNKDQQGIYATVMQLHTKTAGRDGKDCIVGFGHPNGFLAEKPA